MENTEDYLLAATKQKEIAGKKLAKEIEKSNEHFEFLRKKALPEDQQKITNVISQAKSILEQVRNGGDVHDLVSQIQKLKF